MPKISFLGPPKCTQILIFGLKIYVPSGNPLFVFVNKTIAKERKNSHSLCLKKEIGSIQS
jgi:hypothetical protein